MELAERELRLDEDVALTDVQGRVRFLRTDRGLLATVSVTAGLKGACSRCLTPVNSPLRIKFQEEFISIVDPVSGARITPEEAEQSFIISDDLMLDLGEALRQYAMMSAPSKPLCRADCQGLCPTCGANLSEGACACPPPADERWSTLVGYNIDQEGS